MSIVTMPIAARTGTREAYLEIEQEAQALGDALHRRRSDLTATGAKPLLRDGADLIAEHVADAAQTAFWRAHFHMKGDAAVCSCDRKHHDEACSASVETVRRHDDRGTDEILFMAS